MVNNANRFSVLPTLGYLSKLFSDDIGIFEEWACIFVQHILWSNTYCIDFLEHFGISKSNLYIIGKAYSTNQGTYDYLKHEGYNLVNAGCNYNYSYYFDNSIEVEATKILDMIIDRGITKVLVLDEGGYAIKAVSDYHRSYQIKFAFVELTSRGAFHYSLISNAYPIIDVARSVIKKTTEAPIIARSMFENIERACHSKDIDIKSSRWGIIGSGAIGKNIINLFSDISNIYVYDKISMHNIPRNITIPEMLDYCDIILSSTGCGAIHYNDIIDLKSDITLINCGSSDVEFNPWNIKSMIDSEGDVQFMAENPSYPWYGSLYIITHEANIEIFKGGFPINFDGSEDPIPENIIQITRSLLMAGSLQAVKTDSIGIIPLDLEIQYKLNEIYSHIVKKNIKT